ESEQHVLLDSGSIGHAEHLIGQVCCRQAGAVIEYRRRAGKVRHHDSKVLGQRFDEVPERYVRSRTRAMDEQQAGPVARNGHGDFYAVNHCGGSHGFTSLQRSCSPDAVFLGSCAVTCTARPDRSGDKLTPAGRRSAAAQTVKCRSVLGCSSSSMTAMARSAALIRDWPFASVSSVVVPRRYLPVRSSRSRTAGGLRYTQRAVRWDVQTAN